MPRQPFKQNQFGFTAGVPVWIPRVYNGRNRTFFFADYEGLRRRTSASSNVLDIPPLDYRKGDFSRYLATIYDVRSRRIGPNNQVIADPLPGTFLTASLLFPGSVETLNLLPAPNFGAPGVDARNFLRIAYNPFDNNQYDIKGDQRISDADTLFGRFSRSKARDPNPGNFDGFIGRGGVNIRNAINSAAGYTHLFAPTVVSELRVGYTRQNGSFDGLGPTGVDFATKNNLALFPFPVQSFPSYVFNYSGLVNTQTQFSGIGGGDPNINIENTVRPPTTSRSREAITRSRPVDAGNSSSDRSSVLHRTLPGPALRWRIF